MIEIKLPEENEMPPNNHIREEAHSIIKLLVNAYNMGYKDGVEAYKAMMEIEREEKGMTREEIIKSALKFLVLKQTEQGSQGFSDSNENEISWDKVIEWLDKQPCEDCISRADVKKYLSAPDANGDRVIYESDLDLLPPVTPQQKIGHWINLEKTKYKGRVLPFWHRYECSKCGGHGEGTFNYCPNCGAKMEENENENDK